MKINILYYIILYFHRDLPILISLGVTGMFGNQLLYLLGVYYTTADIASMFQPLIPVWTTIIAIVTRTEKFPHLRKPKGWAKIMGIILASAGAMTMIMVKHKVDTGSNSKESGELFLGYIFLLGNTICMGVYIVIQKKYIFNKPDSVWRTLPVSVTAWAYFFGFIAMALASLYYVKTPERYTQIPARAIYSIIYAIFITSALCYLLITWCNMQISSTVVTATWPLQVFFTIILSYIFLGEVMSPVQYIGGIMILIGLAFVLWSNFQDEKEFKSLDSENKPLICTTNDVDNNKKA